jgi:thiamine-phosphate pyrophosphorylase
VIVHLVTDRRRLAGGADRGHRERADASVDALLEQAEAAVQAGVDVIQVREPDLQARALASLVSGIVERTRGSRTRVLVNDRVDVALACGADGVHLRGNSVPARRVRAIVPHGFVIGRSVHTVDEAVEHQADVDYLVAGAVWQTVSKPLDHPLLGTAGLEAIVAAVQVPVLGIGGITIDRAREIARAGAAGLAAIGLFQAPPRGGGAALQLREIVEKLRESFDLPA